ncbi:hypothetical protein L0657_00795 [Dyadobacter sp. CY345]|uniref:hypothetical protein n=1 Tax=Dyadobacter sp. CY345 TaxID=2909335 RepID=UPI001F2FD47E|nr:hypothetical protein [Dyadobacter sp. CY345]MCF2442473.1 hypothetical protein [Dyadobacter sp. CY345]
MKNYSIKFLWLFCLLILSVLSKRASAQSITEKKEAAFYSDFYVMQVKPMKFQLTYNWPATDRVLIRISDGNRNLLFTEKVLVYKKYEKLFDLSTFIDGQYTFELWDGEKKFVQSFNITTVTKREATARNIAFLSNSEL